MMALEKSERTIFNIEAVVIFSATDVELCSVQLQLALCLQLLVFALDLTECDSAGSFPLNFTPNYSFLSVKMAICYCSFNILA